ncbi:sugar ABC transporter ATP-binding protein [Phyllobacterium sp. TAF24]|uniref:sugar ABC transporter ATP-binding protein n=1 Tax=Phyllobacterium sp. TAF24 TaxID=3233068 RepID=UPI003F9CB2F6
MTADVQNAVIDVINARVSFGAVKALDGVTLAIQPGECVGLVGHNGAGKSTIVNVINGGLTPHEGSIALSGRPVGNYGVKVARDHGIRCVFQELSLCPNLTVTENTRVMHHSLKGWGWRKQAGAVVRAKLDEIFPGHHISASALVGDLTIAERQMVEIATAFSEVAQKVKLIILDEPTSSLDAGLAAQLLNYVRTFVEAGGSVIFISHILGEILSTCDRIVIMKDGKVVATKPASEFTEHGLVEIMGSVVKAPAARVARVASNDEPVLSAAKRQGQGLAFRAHRGEIIGLAGLGGHGQTETLIDLYFRHSGSWLRERTPRVTFVAGDRTLNGVFPLWSILKNLSIGSLTDLSSYGVVNHASEVQLVQSWKSRIEIRTKDTENRILSLSGGNQQKVLFARALATQASVVLMDDPMRGVDIGTKQEVYSILRSEADNGRTFIWYSTEMDEICLCDRVYVFNNGIMVAELSGGDVTEKNVLAASFMGAAA